MWPFSNNPSRCDHEWEYHDDGAAEWRLGGMWHGELEVIHSQPKQAVCVHCGADKHTQWNRPREVCERKRVITEDMVHEGALKNDYDSEDADE